MLMQNDEEKIQHPRQEVILHLRLSISKECDKKAIEWAYTL